MVLLKVEIPATTKLLCNTVLLETVAVPNTFRLLLVLIALSALIVLLKVEIPVTTRLL